MRKYSVRIVVEGSLHQSVEAENMEAAEKAAWEKLRMQEFVGGPLWELGEFALRPMRRGVEVREAKS